MKGQECFPGSRMESGGEKTHLGTKGYAETEQNWMQEAFGTKNVRQTLQFLHNHIRNR